MSHHQEHCNYVEKFRAELESLENQAGIRDEIASSSEYHGSDVFRRVYFGVADKTLRKALIAKVRELTQEVNLEHFPSNIADAKESLEAVRNRETAKKTLFAALSASTLPSPLPNGVESKYENSIKFFDHCMATL